jgi:excisionase family DNA binding protein
MNIGGMSNEKRWEGQTNMKSKATRTLRVEAAAQITPTTELLNIREAAAYLRLTVSTIRAWVHQRRIPSCKLGRRVFVRRGDLDSLIARSVRPATEIAETVA